MLFKPQRLFSRKRLLFPLLVTCSRAYTTMSVTERDAAGTITVSPRNEADQSALVVICHGLGDTAEGFVDVAEVSYRRWRCRYGDSSSKPCVAH